MKRNFWNKKQSEYTGKDTIWLFVTLMAMLYAIGGAFYAIVCYWENLNDCFHGLKRKLKYWIHHKEWEEFDKLREEEP